MKIKLSTLRVGDVIEIDCGYGPREDMQRVTVIDIGQSIDLWNKALTLPCITVRDSNGETFSVQPDLFG